MSSDCSYIVNSGEAKCTDVNIKLKQAFTSEFNLKLYVTQDECTIPSVTADADSNFEMIKEKNDIAGDDDGLIVSFGEVDLESRCGLVNLIVVMATTNDEHVEHLATPLFINCSNVDFKIEVEKVNHSMGPIAVRPGQKDPLSGKVDVFVS